MTYAACYDLTLQCDFCSPRRHESTHAHFTDEFGSKCRKMARAKGWKLFKDGTCRCPTCNLNPKSR